MGLFNFFKSKLSNGTFVTEAAFHSNRSNQMQMVPQILDQLRKLDVPPEKELKLEFFFYTNTDSKAEMLATEIEKIGYRVEHGISAGDKKLFIITGWTTKMKMTDEVVGQWTKRMCEVGYEYDCEFDGWGTEPDQN